MRYIVVLAAFALASCSNTTVGNGPTPQQHRQNLVNAAVRECQSKIKTKQLTTLAAYGRCLAAAESPLAVGDYADLIRLKSAKRTEIFERVDAGQITPTQAEAELAEVTSNLVGEINRRSNSRQALILQEIAASSASAPVTCNRFGNSMTCF